MSLLPCLDNQPASAFPRPQSALCSPSGLLAYGGDLSRARLTHAYQQGIFPWFSEHEPILWWCPDPRAVLPVDQFHLSRSMQRFHARSPYVVTLNQAFPQVIEQCAALRAAQTWITAEVKSAWMELALAGQAQSVEVWLDGELVGGLYGMALGGLFCGESMFSTQPNASKTALMLLCQHFSAYGGSVIDCQILNPHTASLGAREIARADYLRQLEQLKNGVIAADCWTQQRIF